MASFLEKLKKGMGAEVEQEKPAQSASGIEAGPPQSPPEVGTSWRGLGVEKPVKKQKKSKKLEIKMEKVEVTESKKEEQAIKKEGWFEQEGQLAVDVYETDGELVIQTAIAGVKPEDLDISIENDRVLIKGERTQASKEEGKNYFYQECYWGAFSREIILPGETDPSRAEASMKQNVLTIRLPKIEREKKRKIEVRT